ncbi:hypothetical protein [Photobacterium leiognathi]|uniref:hypothetical protein n=1 Tax=Photobacterium leiognathi TaxID=553611 RepID=UPI00273968B8|nr:hypothetical protein [Photobacterium leiognathi]
MRHTTKVKIAGNSCSVSIQTKIVRSLDWHSNELLSGYLVKRSGLVISKRNVDLGELVFHGTKRQFNFVADKNKAINLKLIKQGSGITIIIDSAKQELLMWLIKQELVVRKIQDHIQIEPKNGCNQFNLPDLSLLTVNEISNSYRIIQNRLLKVSDFGENDIDTLALLSNMNKLHKSWDKKIREHITNPTFTITN